MSPAQQLVEQLESLTTDQPMTPAGEGQIPRPAPPLKHHQVQAYTDELRRLGEVASGVVRDPFGNPMPGFGGTDSTLARKRVKEIRKILAAQAPKPITGPRANQVFGLLKRLRDEVFKPNMLEESAARRAPHGAVGHLQRTEFTPLWTRAAVAYKRAARGLDPDNADPDLANINRFRKSDTGANGTATFTADAVIPGNFAFGAQAKENWPLGEPTIETAVKQVQRREAAADPAVPKVKRPRTPAQLAHIERLKALSAARRGAGLHQPTTEASTDGT